MIEYDDKCSGKVIEIDKISNLTKPLFMLCRNVENIKVELRKKYIYFSKDSTLFLTNLIYLLLIKINKINLINLIF